MSTCPWYTIVGVQLTVSNEQGSRMYSEAQAQLTHGLSQPVTGIKTTNLLDSWLLSVSVVAAAKAKPEPRGIFRRGY